MGKGDKVELDKFLEICKKMKLRRNIEMSNIETNFLKKIYSKIN